MSTATDESKSSPLRGLYPEIEPHTTGFLKLDDVHTMYYEQAGNPEGKPVVFLHGGPGGGLVSKYRQFFDPEKYHITLFDQRGTGQSTPFASLENNTTWHLVEDIEKLRKHVSVEKWMVFGGSWGSCLALAYAQTHPTSVSALVLRGIFMLRRKELEWFYQEGASFVYPDAWEPYLNHIPEEERGDLMAAYYKRLTSDDKETRLAAAKAWSMWEGATSYLIPTEQKAGKYGEEDFAVPFARIECHYFVNGGWFEDEQLLKKENIDKIRDIPGYIVQGRYDMVCPYYTAFALHKAWPEAEFDLMPTSGHSCLEPAITDALVRATDRMA